MRPLRVLLAEDNQDDVELTRMALEGLDHQIELHRVENGLECLRFLRREPPHADMPPVDLVLLDLNMPVMDGREVLQALSSGAGPGVPPIVVLTTSRADIDLLDAYDALASGYVTKPVNFLRFRETLLDVVHFWGKVARLPVRA
jgi:two-component system, chemotaxis family, response regulator Rcp1